MMIHDDSWWFMMIHTDIGWYLEVSWHLGIFIRPSQNGDAKLIGLGSLNEAAKRALAPMSLMERPCSWYALGESLEAFNLNLKLQSELLPPAILTARPVESVFLKFCQQISEANIVVIHECQHWKWWICPSPLYIYTYIIYIYMYVFVTNNHICDSRILPSTPDKIIQNLCMEGIQWNNLFFIASG